MNFLSRSELLIGKEGLDKLANAHVLVIGLGGVGSYAAEVLARAGIGSMTIVDGDTVVQSNVNRQLQALHSTIDNSKSELMAERILDINPDVKLIVVNQFLMPDDMDKLISNKFDFVLDCIDSVAPKIQIITLCKQRKIKFISSMGAGGKKDPSKIKIADLDKTKDCYFSRDIRKRLRKMRYDYGIKVVYSDEFVDKKSMQMTEIGTPFKRSYYGTISYMPAMFGMTMASYVIRKLLG